MIFQHTHQWIWEPSPNTGEVKTETTRFYASGVSGLFEKLVLIDGLDHGIPSYGAIYHADFGRNITKVGKVLAVSPGRGKKGIGHIRVLQITVQDVTTLTPAQVKAEGFKTWLDFIKVVLDKHEEFALKKLEQAIRATPDLDDDTWCRSVVRSNMKETRGVRYKFEAVPK